MSTPCPMCGRKVEKRPRHAKLRYPHKCPHGKWCAQGQSQWGSHSNGRPPPAQACCRAPKGAWIRVPTSGKEMEAFGDALLRAASPDKDDKT